MPRAVAQPNRVRLPGLALGLAIAACLASVFAPWIIETVDAPRYAQPGFDDTWLLAATWLPPGLVIVAAIAVFLALATHAGRRDSTRYRLTLALGLVTILMQFAAMFAGVILAIIVIAGLIMFLVGG